MTEDITEAVPRGVDFETTGEEYWRIERFDRLAADFGLKVEDLPDWHALMSKQGRAWEIMERLYQVGSMLDAPAHVLVEWKKPDIAKNFGIPVAQVESELAHAVNHWKLTHARAELNREASSAVVGEDEIDRLTSFSSGADIDTEKVDKLLEAFNFKEIKDPLQRVTVAKRILSLRDYLASPHTRTAAREIIRFENTMHALEKTLTGYQNKIERLTAEDPEQRSSGTEVEALSKKAQELDKEIRAIGVSHAKLQKEIGADDIDMTTRKRIFVETVAFIQEKCREYESEPENVLLDGVFRAGEIDWLMEPLGERKPQYRPDISVRLADALLPQNLWDPEYHPPKITIRVCQELEKLVNGMRAVPDDAPPLAEIDDSDDALVGTVDAVDAPLDDGETAQAVEMHPNLRRRDEEEDEVMGVY